MLPSLFGIDLVYVVSGFVVGALIGITGVGGGSLMTPTLVLFGVHPVTAVGTDLLYAAVTKTGGTLVHHRAQSVDWRIVARLAAGSVPAAFVSLIAFYGLHLDSSYGQTVIPKILAVALLLTSLSLALRGPLTRIYAHRVHQLLQPGHVRLLTTAAGVLLGILVSMSSVGAGALCVTVLIFLYPEMGTGKIVASDIAHAVPLTLIAGIGHWTMGSVDLALLASLLLGSLPGVALASRLAPRVPEMAVRILLAVVLILVSIKMLSY